MTEKLRKHIETLFYDIPKTRKSVDLREEILANAEEKYQDLRKEGYREDDAYEIVIHSIGDISELFADLDNGDTDVSKNLYQKKWAMLTATAVGLYIFSGVVFFIFVFLDDITELHSSLDFATIGLIAAGLLCIPPTCMLVYASKMYPRYEKEKESMIEEFKEWQSGNGRNKAIQSAISQILWTLTVIIYIAINFCIGAWRISWVIFLIAGCMEAIIKLCFSLKENEVS